MKGVSNLTSKGQTLVEMTLMLPIILIFVGGLTDVGLAFFVSTSMENAVREGARLAASGMSTPNVKTEVLNRISGKGMFKPALTPADVTVVATAISGTGCTTAQNSFKVTASGTYNYMFLNLVGISSTLMQRSETMRDEASKLCP